MQSISLSRILSVSCRVSFIVAISLALSLGLVVPVSAQEQTVHQRMTVNSPPTAMHDVKPTSLHALIEESLQKNAEIATSSSAWRASQNVPKELAAFPDTQISVQQFSVGSPRPFAGYSNSDFAYVGFGISQDIPYPGKRQLLAKAATQDSESMAAETDSVRRNVVSNLKMAYFRLAYIQQTLGILQKNEELLNQIQQAAESRYRVGQGSQQDVLKTQLQHTKILQQFAHHHEEEGLLEAQIKELLGRPQESPDIATETLAVRNLPYSAAELMQKAREQNPDLRSQAFQAWRRDTQVELAHKNFRPDFNVEYTYEHTASQFRDYYMATFSVRLPNRGRQKAELAEAQEKEEQSKQELDFKSQQVLSEVQQEYVKVKTSEDRSRYTPMV